MPASSHRGGGGRLPDASGEPLRGASPTPIPGQPDEYAHVASVYDFLLNPFLDPLRRALTRRVVERGAASVLDLCCGTGRQLAMLHRVGVRATGVDASPAMLARARRVCPADIDFRLEDAGATSLPDAGSDAVIISFALHEKPAPVRDAILAEARRTLAPGGACLVVDYLAPDSRRALRMHRLVNVVERLAGAEHHALYGEFLRGGGLEALLVRNGLSCAGLDRSLGGAAGICTVRPA